jgi:hypothetical protein
MTCIRRKRKEEESRGRFDELKNSLGVLQSLVMSTDSV